jgi:hypothetical protein
MLMSLWAVNVGEAHGSVLLEEEACVTFMSLISNLESWTLVIFVCGLELRGLGILVLCGLL